MPEDWSSVGEHKVQQVKDKDPGKSWSFEPFQHSFSGYTGNLFSCNLVDRPSSLFPFRRGCMLRMFVKLAQRSVLLKRRMLHVFDANLDSC